MHSLDTALAEPEAEPPEHVRGAFGAPKMSFHSAVFSMTNTIIGSGTLTIPFIFAQCGWLTANALALLVLSLTTYSVHLLATTCDALASDAICSFEALGYECCGFKGSIYAEVTFIVGGMGTLTGYLIFISKLAAQVIGCKPQSSWIPMLCVLLFVIVPLTWPRKIASLRYASYLAFVAILYVVVMYCCFTFRIGHYDDDPSGNYEYDPVRLAFWTGQSISSVNLLFGAFCVQNTCIPIYRELVDRSPRKMVRATVCAMLIAFSVYEIIGTAGYILLGGNVKGNSLLNFDDPFVSAHPWTGVPRDLAKIVMVCTLSLSFPLALWPCRSAICSVLLRMREGGSGPARGYQGASDAMFHSVTLGVLLVVSVLAIATPDVTIPLSLVNSLAGGSMIFVMPGLFHLAALRRASCRPPARRSPAIAMVVLGVFCCALGFGLQVRTIVREYG